jgi:hypothetical protein
MIDAALASKSGPALSPRHHLSTPCPNQEIEQRIQMEMKTEHK